MEFEEYQVDFAKAISTPEYRKFCNDYKLDFHFWDKISEDQFDPKIASEEIELHWKTRSLFNKTKEIFPRTEKQYFSILNKLLFENGGFLH